jgi:hypothetical protein
MLFANVKDQEWESRTATRNDEKQKKFRQNMLRIKIKELDIHAQL